MRLTICVCSGIRDITVRRWNRVWRCRGKFYDYPPTIPPSLIAKGINVIEVNKIETPRETWSPPVPDDPRCAQPIPLEQQPDWKQEPAFIHHDNVRLFEGVKQACLIAKAQHFQGFPSAVESLVGAIDIPDKDLILQRFIMQSQKWNTDEVKLPKPFDPRKPRWSWVRPIGITPLKSSQILLRNIIRLCQTQIAEFPSFNTRKSIYDQPLYSHVIYKGKPIVMKESLDALLTSSDPLPPFGNEATVDASASHKIPDMWPVFPTVDFLETNNYELSSEIGIFNSNLKLTNPHTIIQIPRKYHWEQKHYQAAQIMTCLMYTAALARQKYGNDVRALPEPISVQHVSLEQNKFLFAFFQLNTLDLDSDNGIKNLVWTADRADLFTIIPGQPWMPKKLKTTRYENFEPLAFDKFLAVYLSNLPEVAKQ
ncbi:unnamed protein product [Lymnaea stagnalis]|uniref:39S ribosomal protein L37, mitochondrial n=1 Tax=Lymnaea stagnalis TaxID=6523 RepID=A0AAV2H6V5_LYMST